MTVSTASFENWVRAMPKAELHLHIDGSLEARRLLQAAAKNGVDIPYSDEASVLAAYDFADLQSFLDLYYLGASVIRDEEDFYHLTMDYLQMCRQQNIVHTEIMVEPQTYTANGIAFETLMNGTLRAVQQAREEWGQSVLLILSLLRHLSEQDCLDTLAAADPWRAHFAGLGLASSENGHPPEKFLRLYAAARERGYYTTAHAGEEGPAVNIATSLDQLKVQRIDHGIRCTEAPALMARLEREQVPLTVCPLSNVRLKSFATLADHNIMDMFRAGLLVTVNSDDPAYFGGYLNENLIGLHTALGMTGEECLQLVRNGFLASMLDDADKQRCLARLDAWCEDNPVPA
ncbi:MAG: adenosine deaminase [Halieaceae bacterium]|jgi:adenosine deaminase|nr:adenosine deaminase [Halieaceae bacterium]